MTPNTYDDSVGTLRSLADEAAGCGEPSRWSGTVDVPEPRTTLVGWIARSVFARRLPGTTWDVRVRRSPSGGTRVTVARTTLPA